jgi:hypothetical protein
MGRDGALHETAAACGELEGHVATLQEALKAYVANP